LLWLGCSRKEHSTAPVSGTVTYKNQPVYSGTITFIDVQGHAGWGDIHDGQYALRAPLGECRVAISSRETEPAEDPKHRKQARPGMLLGKSSIPEKYENPERSHLTFKVEDRENTANFKLVD
jgi:hypothetical protein